MCVCVCVCVRVCVCKILKNQIVENNLHNIVKILEKYRCLTWWSI